jgi:hypothetical protein
LEKSYLLFEVIKVESIPAGADRGLKETYPTIVLSEVGRSCRQLLIYWQPQLQAI